jgi:cobalt transporter subunit CbtB
VSGEVLLQQRPLGNREGQQERQRPAKSGDLPRQTEGHLPLLNRVARRVSMTTRVSTVQLSISRRIAAGLAVIFVGSSLLYAVGLSDMTAAHNAAHDTRHAIGFPCH